MYSVGRTIDKRFYANRIRWHYNAIVLHHNDWTCLAIIVIRLIMIESMIVGDCIKTKLY